MINVGYGTGKGPKQDNARKPHIEIYDYAPLDNGALAVVTSTSIHHHHTLITTKQTALYPYEKIKNRFLVITID